jgi:phosphatidylserine/phosphatidylglycerophosphate/cardiolipin synthase-like enzyme
MRRALLSLLSLPLFTACAAPDTQTGRLDLGDVPGVADPYDGPALAMWTTAPGSPAALRGESAVADALVALLDASEDAVDASVYELSDPAITDAMLRAWDRGVHVRLVTDGDEAGDAGALALATAGVPISMRPKGDRIMHDKFVVVDHQVVWTGSTNLTPTGLLRNDNDAVLLESPALAAAYTAELDQMAVEGDFGRRKVDLGGARDFGVGDADLRVHFSPQHDPIDAMVDLVDGAEHSVSFLVFSFTHPDLRDALLRAHDRGVEVVGVFDASQAASSWSVDEALADAGVSVYIDGNHENVGFSGGKLHHKLMLVDAGAPDADPVLATGSFNWSRAGTNDNDENLLEIRDAGLQAQARETFCARLALATPHPASAGAPVNPCSGAPALVINELLPNPTGTDRGQEFVEIINAGAAPVDLTGWSIGDARATDRHVFGATTLAPGDGIVVFDMGDHSGVPNAISSSSGYLSLNNAGDRVELRAPDGAVADAVSYGTSRDGVSWNRAVDGDSGAGLVPHAEALDAVGSQSPGTLASGRGFLEGPRFQLVINELMPDPAGTDRGQEYVEIVNLGPDAAPLDGITLWDASGMRHRFGAGSLPVGAALVLFDQGEHGDVEGALSSSTGFLSLNNAGDTLTLEALDGSLLDTVAWSDSETGESWTRSTDADPDAPLVLHADASPTGALASPGQRSDGSDW